MKSPFCHALGLLVSVCYLASANAAPTEPDDKGQPAYIEDVIVTARRVEENAQDIPVAVSSFSAAELRESIIADLSDLSGKTPHLELDFSAPISGASSAAAVYLRGVGQVDFLLTNDPAVGIYLDGVYISRALGAVLSLVDVERVEILRGPQGTLFGRNTIGGAINVVSQKPIDETSGRISATLGNLDRRDVSAMLNLPLIDEQLLLRVAAASESRDGYMDRILAGDTLGSRNRDSAMVSLRWLATQDLSIDFAADYSRIDEDSAPGNTVWQGDTADFGRGLITDIYNAVAAPVVDLPGFGPGTLMDDRFLTGDASKSNGTGPNGTYMEIYGAAMTVDFSAPRYQLRSITSYRELDAVFGRDADSAPITLAETESIYKQHQFSQEFQLTNAESYTRLKWLGGLYYFEESGDNLEAAAIAPDVFAVTGASATAFSLLGDIAVKNTSSAIFGHGTYYLDERLSLSGGLRYTYEKKRADVQFVAVDLGFPLIGDPYGSEDFDDLSYKFSVNYMSSQESLLYASASTGFKSGGFTGRYVQPTPALQPFEPEQLMTYELGLKADWLEKRLRTNAAVFFSDYEDIQILIFDGVAPQTRNAGEGEITGFELEATYLATDKISVSAYLGYIDAKYTSLNTGVAVALFAPIEESDAFVNTPEWSGGITLGYSDSLSDVLSINANINYSWQDEVANDAINTPELIQASRSLLNMRASLAYRSRYEVALFGKNLTDESYIVSGSADIPTFGGVEAVYAPPREWGVELSSSF